MCEANLNDDVIYSDVSHVATANSGSDLQQPVLSSSDGHLSNMPL